MGWLNTFVNVASFGAEVAQLSKLEALKQQGAEAAMIQAVLQALRNQIFQYNQAAKEILTVEEQNPKLAAGGMRVLQLRLEDSGIKPEMFPDLSDKEYVANTFRTVRENSSRLWQQLPEETRAEVASAAEAAEDLPRYEYYLMHYDAAQELKAAVPIYEKYKGRDNCLVRSGSGLLGVFVAPLLLFGCALMAGDMMGERAAGLLSCVALLAWFGVLFGIFKLNNVPAYNEAKKTIQQYKDSDIDLDRFVYLEKEFGVDKTAVINMRDQAEKLVDNFFQGTQFLTA